MAPLPPAIAPRVGALLRLLGSDVDGEALGAARALGRSLRDAGVDWHALAEAVEPGPETVFVERPRPAAPRRSRKARPDHGHISWSPTYRREVRETLERGLVRLSFSEWERGFIANIITRLRDPHGRLTFRQAEVVDRLVAKIEGIRS